MLSISMVPPVETTGSITVSQQAAMLAATSVRLMETTTWYSVLSTAVVLRSHSSHFYCEQHCGFRGLQCNSLFTDAMPNKLTASSIAMTVAKGSGRRKLGRHTYRSAVISACHHLVSQTMQNCRLLAIRNHKDIYAPKSAPQYGESRTRTGCNF